MHDSTICVYMVTACMIALSVFMLRILVSVGCECVLAGTHVYTCVCGVQRPAEVRYLSLAVLCLYSLRESFSLNLKLTVMAGRALGLPLSPTF